MHYDFKFMNQIQMIEVSFRCWRIYTRTELNAVERLLMVEIDGSKYGSTAFIWLDLHRMKLLVALLVSEITISMKTTHSKMIIYSKLYIYNLVEVKLNGFLYWLIFSCNYCSVSHVFVGIIFLRRIERNAYFLWKNNDLKLKCVQYLHLFGTDSYEFVGQGVF